MKFYSLKGSVLGGTLSDSLIKSMCHRRIKIFFKNIDDLQNLGDF